MFNDIIADVHPSCLINTYKIASTNLSTQTIKSI